MVARVTARGQKYFRRDAFWRSMACCLLYPVPLRIKMLAKLKQHDGGGVIRVSDPEATAK